MSDIEAQFWARVDQSGECWEWQGYRTDQGYGEAYDGYGMVRAHRLAWELTHGPIPAGKIIRHRCDNPPCVRPDHLLIGTHADNVADKVARDRQARAERNGRARLTADRIRVEARATSAPSASRAALSLCEDVLTVDMIRAVMDQLRNAPYRVCHHIAPPNPPGYEWRMDTAEEAVRIIPCGALCGTPLFLIPVETGKPG